MSKPFGPDDKKTFVFFLAMALFTFHSDRSYMTPNRAFVDAEDFMTYAVTKAKLPVL